MNVSVDLLPCVKSARRGLLCSHFPAPAAFASLPACLPVYILACLLALPACPPLRLAVCVRQRRGQADADIELPEGLFPLLPLSAQGRQVGLEHSSIQLPLSLSDS